MWHYRGFKLALWLAARVPRWLGYRLAFFGAQHLLHAAHRIAFLVEQPVDPPCELDVLGTIIAAVAGALQGAKLREA